jgi:site-specific recombinase XerC
LQPAHDERRAGAAHGLDILSVKELLGHENIETTMIYLHVAQNERRKLFSPLDTLFEACKPR